MLNIYSELPITAQSPHIRMPLIMESKSCDEIFGCSVSVKARWTTSLFPSPHSEKENYLTEKSLLNFQHSDREPKSPLLTQDKRMSAGVGGGDLTPINAAMRASAHCRESDSGVVRLLLFPVIWRGTSLTSPKALFQGNTLGKAILLFIPRPHCAPTAGV